MYKQSNYRLLKKKKLSYERKAWKLTSAEHVESLRAWKLVSVKAWEHESLRVQTPIFLSFVFKGLLCIPGCSIWFYMYLYFQNINHIPVWIILLVFYLWCFKALIFSFSTGFKQSHVLNYLCLLYILFLNIWLRISMRQSYQYLPHAKSELFSHHWSRQ